MNRLHKTAPIPVLFALLLSGCGGEIARIDGLPETRDVSDVPWPRLVDTPAVPTDALLPAQGERTFAMLNDAQQTVLTRAALPGTAPVPMAELDGRVARIRQQTTVTTPGVDQADLAARAARLSQVRAAPVVAVSEAELQARAQRIAVARQQAESGVDAAELRNRGQRVAAARAQGTTGLDSAVLAARANRVTAGSQTYYGSLVDRDDLAQRSQRIDAVTMSPSSSSPASTPSALTAKRDEAAARRATPEQASAKAPVASRPEREKPVISDSFRKRAEEARRKARERAKKASAE